MLKVAAPQAYNASQYGALEACQAAIFSKTFPA